MAGTRIHTTRLAELSGEPSVPILHAGSGPAVAVERAACGAAFPAILVFRSTTSLDFIYFQF